MRLFALDDLVDMTDKFAIGQLLSSLFIGATEALLSKSYRRPGDPLLEVDEASSSLL